MTKIYVCFVPCWKNSKQYTKIHFLYRTCSNFNPIPFHHHRKNNERSWCFIPPCEKAEHWTKKGCSKRVLQNFFTMLATHTPFFLYSQELFDCFHLFHRIQQVFASTQVTLLCPCSWYPLLECPFPYALLFFTKWFEAPNSFSFLSVVKEDWGWN